MENKRLKAFIINTLRKASFRWKSRGEAKKRYKVKVGEFKTGRDKFGYKCEACKEVFMSKEVQMDHLYAVVNPVTGFIGFDDYCERMFCDEDGFCCLCSSCHDYKTSVEKDFRMKFRELEKNGEESPVLELEYYTFLENYKE